MAADLDVISRQREMTEAVADSGKSGHQSVMPFSSVYLPSSNLTVLVSSEDFSVTERDRFNGAGKCAVGIECFEMNRSGGIVDSDVVAGRGVEESRIDNGEAEGGDWLEGGGGEREWWRGEREAESVPMRERLKRRNRWHCLESEVALEAAAGSKVRW
ncbi:hypothetical protein Ancab_021263 [Ancistrocladus abbreviatus]